MPLIASEPTKSQAQRLRLYGSTQAPAPVLRLQAGALCCTFEDGAIRDLKWQGMEILRGISYLLRDRNWGTAPAVPEQCEVEQGEGVFSLRFVLRMVLPEGTLLARALVNGNAQGQFRFEVQAEPDAALWSNRCGFVVLHPASAAGAPLQVEHTDGTLEETRFPVHISPGQVAFNIRRLRHTPMPGLDVDCLLQAELPHDPLGKFEMEDQRNWSDASFKTYVASLLDAWPYLLPVGTALAQAVRVAVHDAREKSVQSHGQQSDSNIHFGPASGHLLPPIGLGVPLGLTGMREPERQCVLALRPAWLVAEVDTADQSGMPAQLEALQSLARACSARVQLDAICAQADTPEAAAQRLAQACGQLGLKPDAMRACPSVYLHSYQPTDVWPTGPSLEDYASAFAQQFPQTRIGGGMLTYFTELNRKRQSAASLHFIAHATCPLVHAADDLSVMQTHESLASIMASVRRIWPGLAYRLGPITLGMQRNPYGGSVAANTQQVRLAMAQDDPRHHAAFGAAWIAGYAAAVADGGLELLSFNHSHGVSGPLLHQGHPDWQAGACIPSWRVQAVLAQASGCAQHQLSGLPQGMVGIAWRAANGRREMLLANRGPETLPLRLYGDWSTADLSLTGSAQSLGYALPETTQVSTLGAYEVLRFWQ